MENKTAHSLVNMVLSLPISIYVGWVVSWVWFWFVVPLGVPVIGVVHAMGLQLVVMIFNSKYVKPSKDIDLTDLQSEALIFWFFIATVALVYGYVLHTFFM